MYKFLSLSLFIFFNTIVISQSSKLIVGIVVDQMCLDYLYRFEKKFSENGFKKLMEKGTFCVNTHYNYVPTYTGPGHASIYTGTTPNNHGIVANEWYDRKSKKEKYCVTDSTVKTIGNTNSSGEFSPRNLKTLTITDQLKLTYSKSKVVSISLKNRSAILPGGHLSDGTYWYDNESGNMVSSTFYKKQIPNWVNDFNEKKMVDAWMQKEWNTLLPIQDYTESEVDDSPYEHLIAGKSSPVFPYEFSNITDNKKYNWFTYTPFANSYLTDFTISAIQEEKLGTDEVIDFLALSYSTPDIAGHAFGPYSVEIEDMYLRLDKEIEKLLNYLEKNIGKNQFILFLTADHAVVPVPQYLVDKKMPGGYVFMNTIKEDLNQLLKNEFQTERLVEEIENNNVYLNRELLANKNIQAEKVEELIANYLIQIDGIKTAYTRNQILFGDANDKWLSMIKKGYRHQESGDLIFVLEPGYLPKSKPNENTHKGTSHGSAFNYDTHVPLLWYGNNIPSQKIVHLVEITDIVPTLAPILKISLPSTCIGKPIEELFKK
ncbi:MAG: alkaline phosphatase family protein [Flavobacteriia bacterium]|nr:alkaline phosphatase family protein [Flavobacteriia bacterium]